MHNPASLITQPSSKAGWAFGTYTGNKPPHLQAALISRGNMRLLSAWLQSPGVNFQVKKNSQAHTNLNFKSVLCATPSVPAEKLRKRSGVQRNKFSNPIIPALPPHYSKATTTFLLGVGRAQ